MTDFAVNDPVEVVVVSKRGKEPEWVPAVVSFIDEGRIEVMFEGGSKQRFVLGTERIRTPGGGVEGEQWVFQKFSQI